MQSKTKHKNVKSKANVGWTAAQTARRNTLAEYLFQKYSIDKARELTQLKLELKTYSRSTAYLDYEALLEEWQKKRVGDMEGMIGAEIAEIEYTQSRLWQRINERNGKRKKITTKGRPDGDAGKIKPLSGKMEDADDDTEIRYIHEINELAKERRKLLGLYAAEKREINGSLTFADTMMAAAVVQAQKGNATQSQDIAADGKPINWKEI